MANAGDPDFGLIEVVGVQDHATGWELEGTEVALVHCSREDRREHFARPDLEAGQSEMREDLYDGKIHGVDNNTASAKSSLAWKIVVA